MPTYSGVWTLQQQLQAKAVNNWPEGPPTTIGQAYGGGFYAGQIGVSSVATHYIIVAPLSSGQSFLEWKNALTDTPGASSDIDGPQNTADMVADGNATVYPCAHFCNNLVVGSYSDWYMPARNELDVCYYGLKPTTQTNTQNGGQPNFSTGINPNAVPARASFYSTTVPGQTSAASFQSGGSEAFTVANYWCSTEFSSSRAKNQNFGGGYTYYGNRKYESKRVRAIRRIPV